MPFPELTALARHLESTASDDRDEHVLNLDRLQEICAYVRTKNVPELTGCLDAAAQFVEILSRPCEFVAHEDVLRLACRTLRVAERAIEAFSEAPVYAPQDFAPPPTAAAAPAPAPQGGPQAARPAAAASPPPAAPPPAAAPPAAAPPAAPVTHAPPIPFEPAKPAPAPVQPAAAIPAPSAGDDEKQGEPALKLNNEMVLGRMLRELGYVTREQLAKGLRTHRQKKLPIGECLLLEGVSPDHLVETLRLQQSLRSGVDFESHKRHMELDKKLRGQHAEMAAQHGEYKPEEAGMRVTDQMFIGEVLLGAGMITKEQLGEAMKIHHTECLRVGDALRWVGAIDERDLAKGLELQARLRHVAGL